MIKRFNVHGEGRNKNSIIQKMINAGHFIDNFISNDVPFSLIHFVDYDSKIKLLKLSTNMVGIVVEYLIEYKNVSPKNNTYTIWHIDKKYRIDCKLSHDYEMVKLGEYKCPVEAYNSVVINNQYRLNLNNNPSEIVKEIKEKICHNDSIINSLKKQNDSLEKLLKIHSVDEYDLIFHFNKSRDKCLGIISINKKGLPEKTVIKKPSDKRSISHYMECLYNYKTTDLNLLCTIPYETVKYNCYVSNGYYSKGKIKPKWFREVDLIDTELYYVYSKVFKIIGD